MSDEPTNYQRALGEGMAAWLMSKAAGQYAQKIMLSLRLNENSPDFPALDVAIRALLAGGTLAGRHIERAAKRMAKAKGVTDEPNLEKKAKFVREMEGLAHLHLEVGGN